MRGSGESNGFMAEVGPFCFRNSLDDPVDGLHVIFSNTQGKLRGARITQGPAGRAIAVENQITIFLATPLLSDMPLCFMVESAHEPIEPHTAIWSFQFNVRGPAERVP